MNRILFAVAGAMVAAFLMNAKPTKEAMDACQETMSYSTCHQMLH